MINFDLQNHKPLREIVYEELKNQILTGAIKPRTRMMEIELADTMGVSRTPVREAIRKLEKDGLVTIEPRKGAYASDVSIKEMLDILEVREELEGLAASLAASRMGEDRLKEMGRISELYREAVKANDTEKIIHYDELFHKEIVAGSGNKTLVQLSEIVQEMVLRFRYIYYEDLSRYETMPKEHREIIEALSSRDSLRARDVAAKHIRKLRGFVASQTDDTFK